jgi:hypothetical protein
MTDGSQCRRYIGIFDFAFRFPGEAIGASYAKIRVVEVYATPSGQQTHKLN